MFKYYEEPTVSYSDGVYSSGYANCGEKDHYLADYDSTAAAGEEYTSLVAFHPTYNIRNSLYFYQDTDYDPVRYYIELDASEELDLGRYEYGFIIEMADYTS